MAGPTTPRWVRRLRHHNAITSARPADDEPPVSAAVGAAFADNRVAGVVDNGAYARVPHPPSPMHDAEDWIRWPPAIWLFRFAGAAPTANEAMFYSIGHTLQLAAIDDRVPVDAQLNDELELRRLVRSTRSLLTCSRGSVHEWAGPAKGSA